MTPDVIDAMATDLILDYVAIRLRHADAADLHTTVALVLPDVDEHYVIELSNGVLNHRPGTTDGVVDATVTLPRTRLNQLLGEVDPDSLLAGDDVEVAGNDAAFRAMLGLLDDFAFWFDIVTR